MNITDFQIHDTDKLDSILAELAEMILRGQQNDPDGFGMVAAAVLDMNNRVVPALNYKTTDGKRVHAEQAAIERYNQMHGEVPAGSIVVTTLSPCSELIDQQSNQSCTDMLNDSKIKKVYCGYDDPTQVDSEAYQHKRFHVMCTKNKKLELLCKRIADTFLKDHEDK